MNKGAFPVTPRGSSDLAQSLKADLLTSLDALGRQGQEGGLEVPCPIAPPMITPPATPNHDLPHGGMAEMPSIAEMPAMPEHGVHGNAAWWDTPVAPAKSWCAPPDCLELLQRPGQQNCVDLLQRPPTDCVKLLQRPPTDCVEVFKAHKQGRQIPRQIPPRQQQALSAYAPEFVPEGSSVVVPASSVPLPPSMLEDSVSGLLHQGEAVQAQAEEVAYMPSMLPVQQSTDPDSMCCPPTAGSALVPAREELDDVEGSQEDTEQQKPSIKVEDLPSHIPSIGSLGHDCGDCRRCNFFHKGRCSNGRACAFCHFPHEKRKTARKEGQQADATEESTGFQVARGAPGLERPDQLTPGSCIMPLPMAPRPVKVSVGTQTEDDLPPCLLCNEPPSAQGPKVLKKGMKEDHSSSQGNTNAARIGGC